MKKANFFSKLSVIVGLICGLPLLSIADVNIYICSTASATLNYVGGHTLVAGDRVIWQEFDGADNPIGAGPVELTYTSSLTDVALTLSAASDITTLGSHFYKAYVLSANPANCSGDLSDEVEIYRLPDLILDLTPLISSYCAEASGTTAESVITASTTTQESHVLPTDVLLAYNWSATKDGIAVTPISSIGTAQTNNTGGLSLTNTFTMNATGVGEYSFSATVAYPSQSASGITIKGGCSANSNTPAVVTVTPKPGKPTITVD
uniref:Uncharacterized protein n=1 Tax=Sphingobacterium sp. (strain 21) TaxID=743722 RepID=F4C3R1_SPHS2